MTSHSEKMCENCDYYLPDAIGGTCCSRQKDLILDKDNCRGWTPKHGEWIPMSVAQPDDGEQVTVLVAKPFALGCPPGEVIRYTTTANRRKDRWLQEFGEGYVVTHWMRHPEFPPYNEIVCEMAKQREER